MTGRGAVALAAALALTAPACSKPAPRTYTVRIVEMAYGPAPAELKAGDTIVWVNADIFQHSVTARDRAFDLDLQPKAEGRTVMRRAGRIEVYCRYHPGMTRVLVVKPA